MTNGKMLVAHDFSRAADRALSFAADVARQLDAALEVVYVYPDADDRADLSLVLPDSLPDRSARYLRFLEEELTKLAERLTGQLPVKTKCHVLRGDPVVQIVELARSIEAEWVCVAATGKGTVERVLLGSVSQLVLRSAPVPVLVVP